MERRKNLLGLAVVAVVSDIEGGLAAATAMPETDNTRPSDGDGTGARGERSADVSVGGKREGKKLLRT